MRSTFPVLVCAVALSLPAAARSDEIATYDPRAAHAEADRNGDGRVDHEEFHRRMVEIFYIRDTDRDGKISQAEADGMLFQIDVPARDTDGDGKLSLYEFLDGRFEDFAEVDTNSDGVLSVDEVVEAYQSR